MSEAMHLYAIALGSNRRHGRYGAPQAVVEAAIGRLDETFSLFDVSPVLITPAVGPAGRDFANAVALVESDLDPLALLNALKAMEVAFGRRAGRRWGPRVLDLDIVAWSGGRFRSRRLIIPHARLRERSFVVSPLAAIAPNWRIDGGRTASHLAARLARRRPLENRPAQL